MTALFSNSLRNRLLLVLLTLTALPALLIGGLAYRNARQTVETRVKAQLTSVADLKKEQITTWLNDRAADARLLAINFLNEEHFTEILDPRIAAERRVAFAAFLTDNLRGVQQARAGYIEIMFVDSAGQIILSTDPARVGANVAAYPAVVMTFASPTGEFMEDIHREGEADDIEMAFGHVLHAVDLTTNQVLPGINGAVIIRVHMDETIYPLIRNWPGMGATGETLLARHDGNDALFLNPLHFNENAALNLRVPIGSPSARAAQLSAAGQEGLVETSDYRGVLVLAAYRTIPQTGWGFVAKQDVTEAFAPVTELTRQWILATVLILFVAAGTAVLLSRALTQPLARLVSAARAIAAGNWENSSSSPLERADEIGQLAVAFQTMTAAIRDREAQLKAHAEELELLNHVGRNIAETLDLREIARRVVTQCAERFNDFLCGLLLSDETHAALVVYAAAGRGAHFVTPGERIPLGRGLIGLAALARQTQLANDTAAHADFIPLPGLDIHAEVAVPILREGKLLGVLVVSNDQVQAFRPHNVMLLETFAAQLAPAIENARLFRDLSASYDHTLDALAAALDTRDKETEGHSRRVVLYTLALAQRMNIPEADFTTIRRGALLHDIGKIGVPDAILLKPGPLTDAERAVVRRHPESGEHILASIPFLKDAAQIVCAHQERWDGTGYPRTLAGEAIPLGARIFAVADAFDAITSDRPYRAARPYAVARAEIEAGSGTQFDPRVVEAFQQIPEPEWTRLRDRAKTVPLTLGPLPLWAEPPMGVALPHQLEALNQLIAAVSESLDLKEVLHEAARISVEILGAAASGLFLYDAQTDALSLAADYGLPEALKKRFAHFPVTGFHNEVVVRQACARLHANLAEVPALVELGLPQTHPEWGAYLCVPLTAKGEVTGMMGLFGYRPHAFATHDVALYQAIGEQIGLAIGNARLHERVQQLALTDGLTGAYNRRYLNEFLVKEIQRSARYTHGFSLIMLDIDRFKQYNDTHGHLAGDEILRQIVSLLRQNSRAADLIARYGDEEFIVVLPETEATGALAAAEKIRAVLENHIFPQGRFTASLGVAHCATVAETTPETLIAMADQALYGAKHAGRNRVCLWESKPEVVKNG